jgi:hypothetical protein
MALQLYLYVVGTELSISIGMGDIGANATACGRVGITRAKNIYTLNYRLYSLFYKATVLNGATIH